MKQNLKFFIAYLIIFAILAFIIYLTYVKYTIKTTNDNVNSNKIDEIEKVDTKNIRTITNVNDIKSEKFTISNLSITFNNNEKYINISGKLTNISDDEQFIDLTTYFYDSNKNIIGEKNFKIDNKLEINESINILFNEYYNELDKDYTEIKYYKIDIY